MDLTKFNKMQREAVVTTEGPLLILAGAGSGKTRTLTGRINYLIQEKKIEPWQILAITFTNRAANEMRERIEEQVGESVNDMWVYTFHAMCVRMLRANIELLDGYTRWFSIYDDDDSINIIKQCLKQADISSKYQKPRSIKTLMSDAKNALKNPEELKKDMTDANDFRAAQIYKIYTEYEKKLLENNALDFDDLLVRTLELFYTHPEILKRYSRQFKYINVDEYQDTNVCQYNLVKLLASTHKNLCVVGDDDQSIYGWRGADIKNILNFEKDFKETKVIKLEQNYRSTSSILNAANSVIEKNMGRKAKKLWTDKGQGSDVVLYCAQDDSEEARFVSQEIGRLIGTYNLSDIAVLYRTNAQSRAIEDSLMRSGVNYKMYGGTRFYDRLEIKDMTAYLRIIVNPADEVCFSRIINRPRRGIGNTTVSKIRDYVAGSGKNVTQISESMELLKDCGIGTAACKKVLAFSETINKLREMRKELGIEDFVRTVMDATGYLASYEDVDSDEARSRVENLSELLNTVHQYSQNNPEATLEEFLENVALVSDLDTLSDRRTSITMMTVHSAKGLEFPVVFVVGMDENIFPHQRSLGNPEGVEEERRLCYVAFTRAKDRLYLSTCSRRLTFGMVSYSSPSRFLKEMSRDNVEERGHRAMRKNARPDSRNTSPTYDMGKRVTASKVGVSGFQRRAAKPESKKSDTGIQAGSKVSHDKFGTGTVVSCDGTPGKRIIAVAFDDIGIKKMAEAFAKLKLL